MKKLFPLVAAFVSVATAASAADFPVTPAKVALPPPILFSWTGCYIGIVGGYAQGEGEQVAVAPSVPLGTPIPTFGGQTITGGLKISGGLVGGTVGCNIQISNFVVGVENDLSWSDKKGSTADQPPFNVLEGAVSSTREKWLDTFRGRFGYAIDRFMVYGTAGVAFAGQQVQVSNPATFGTVSETRDRVGWAAGAGAEFAVWTAGWADVTLKLEYLHTGFGRKQFFVAPTTIGGVTVVTRDTTLSDDIIRAGLNFKFNWDSPVTARY
jgi:outer membrane immunogenic protein